MPKNNTSIENLTKQINNLVDKGKPTENTMKDLQSIVSNIISNFDDIVATPTKPKQGDSNKIKRKQEKADTAQAQPSVATNFFDLDKSATKEEIIKSTQLKILSYIMKSHHYYADHQNFIKAYQTELQEFREKHSEFDESIIKLIFKAILTWENTPNSYPVPSLNNELETSLYVRKQCALGLICLSAILPEKDNEKSYFLNIKSHTHFASAEIYNLLALEIINNKIKSIKNFAEVYATLKILINELEKPCDDWMPKLDPNQTETRHKHIKFFTLIRLYFSTLVDYELGKIDEAQRTTKIIVKDFIGLEPDIKYYTETLKHYQFSTQDIELWITNPVQIFKNLLYKLEGITPNGTQDKILTRKNEIKSVYKDIYDILVDDVAYDEKSEESIQNLVYSNTPLTSEQDKLKKIKQELNNINKNFKKLFNNNGKEKGKTKNKAKNNISEDSLIKNKMRVLHDLYVFLYITNSLESLDNNDESLLNKVLKVNQAMSLIFEKADSLLSNLIKQKFKFIENKINELLNKIKNPLPQICETETIDAEFKSNEKELKMPTTNTSTQTDKTDELEQVIQKLNELNTKQAELDSNAAQRKAEIDKENSRIQQQYENLKQREQNLTQQENSLAQQKKQYQALLRKEEEISQKEKKLLNQEKNIEEQLSALAEMTAENEQEKNVLAQQKSELAKQQQAIKEQEKHLDERFEDLKLEQELINEQKTRLSTEKTKLETKLQTYTQKEQQEKFSKQAQEEAANKKMQSYISANQKLQLAIQELQKKINYLENLLTEKVKTIQDLQTSLNRSRAIEQNPPQQLDSNIIFQELVKLRQTQSEELTKLIQNQSLILRKITTNPLQEIQAKLKIRLPGFITDLMATIEQQPLTNGSHAAVFVKGSAVTMPVLKHLGIESKITAPRDIDITTNCPKNVLNRLLADWLKNYPGTSYHEVKAVSQNAENQRYQYIVKIQGTSIDIFSQGEKPFNLSEDASLTDNALGVFYADKNGQVLDPTSILDSFRATPNILYMNRDIDKMLGNPNGGVIITRAIRQANEYGFQLQNQNIETFQKHAASISQLPFNVYLTQIKDLFSKGQAEINYTSLVNTNLIRSILPGTLPETTNNQSKALDTCKKAWIDLDKTDKQDFINTRDIMARLLLLPLTIKLEKHKAQCKTLYDNNKLSWGDMAEEEDEELLVTINKLAQEVIDDFYNHNTKTMQIEHKFEITTQKNLVDLYNHYTNQPNLSPAPLCPQFNRATQQQQRQQQQLGRNVRILKRDTRDTRDTQHRYK